MRTAKTGRTPDDSARKGPATSARTGTPADGLLALQRTAGNAAIVQMLRREGHPETPAQEEHRHGPDCGHRDATASGAAPAVQRSTVHEVLRGSGRPLDGAARADMESRLGADFSDVRIHTDAAAKASASEIGARAYTSGNHIVLGDGGGDRHTLAHELTHVIQQRQGPVAGTDNGSGLRVSDPGDRFEREAEANAVRALAGPAPSADATSEHPTGHHRTAGGPAVQRRKVELKQGPPQASDTQAFNTFFTAVDNAVEWAYHYVITAPQLGPLAKYDGYTKRWVEVWQEFHTVGRSGGISKEFGYAIESVAQARLESAGSPALPAGMHYSTQVTFGTTRPDYVLYAQGNPIGAVDITAAASTGHVLNKTNWDGLFPQFGESVYPSLNPTIIAGMQLAHGNAAPLSQEQADQLKQQAAAKRATWEANWHQMALSFTHDMQRNGILNPDGGVKAGGDPIIRESRRRNAVFSWMTANLGVKQQAAEENATVMLLKFNPSWPASFYCNDTTASESRGEAFLTSVFPEWEQRRGA
ncbi:DUF4157 domain-containing protein [Streptomyces sp. NPDC096132]|uniref:eCIS core domain-containing protein n=1 Tax=Streptomyces sp. NPDC096132 TaxID=3366075 RepID=UPI003823CA8F